MQIVIDVPDSYSFRKSLFEGSLTNDQILDVYRSARNGIILPKGHGRLADMDEAIKCIEEVNGEDAIWAIGLINWACSKRTVLEADNKEK